MIGFNESEIVIALIGAVGTDLRKIISPLENKLRSYNYISNEVRISKEVIKSLFDIEEEPDTAFERITLFMDKGNLARERSQDNAILANGVTAYINKKRQKNSRDKKSLEPMKNTAFIINSLKTPDEIQRLREIYQSGFYVIAVYSEKERRKKNLIDMVMSEAQANNLIERDEDESNKFGQHTRDSFHLSDFFISYDGSEDVIVNSIQRVVDIIFGDPYRTPTFDEFAMFMAFSSALRSADLSRQVGAVVAKDQVIVSTGSNDVPKFGGGVYWPVVKKDGKVVDKENGRDYKRGYDSNSKEKNDIIQDIIDGLSSKIKSKKTLSLIESSLKKSKIKHITEYGRVVHAEMDAILSCARNGISTLSTTLYCTTFPCHNCAKHLVASGVKRVVYIEPYPKSKAMEFHTDSISYDIDQAMEKVIFEPFIGVGPRRFFDLFSMSMSDGFPIKRKDDNGKAFLWPGDVMPSLRIQMYPLSYIEKETFFFTQFGSTIEEFNKEAPHE